MQSTCCRPRHCDDWRVTESQKSCSSAFYTYQHTATRWRHAWIHDNAAMSLYAFSYSRPFRSHPRNPIITGEWRRESADWSVEVIMKYYVKSIFNAAEILMRLSEEFISWEKKRIFFAKILQTNGSGLQNKSRTSEIKCKNQYLILYYIYINWTAVLYFTFASPLTLIFYKIKMEIVDCYFISSKN